MGFAKRTTHPTYLHPLQRVGMSVVNLGADIQL
jgi:hypothetical protein